MPRAKWVTKWKGGDGKSVVELDPRYGSIRHAPPRKMGLWTIDVVNPKSWGTAKVKAANLSNADVMILSETKVTEAKRTAAWWQARELGWNATFGAAMSTVTSSSGGTAILTKKGMGLTGETMGDVGLEDL